MKKITLALLAFAAMAVTAAAQDHDVVILNGRVMDPETKLDAVRNIGIKKGFITAITAEALTGKETIYATGHIVAPGCEKRIGMQPSDIVEVATGEKQTKESFEKLRKTRFWTNRRLALYQGATAL